jgi:hypothetical protein
MMRLRSTWARIVLLHHRNKQQATAVRFFPFHLRPPWRVAVHPFYVALAWKEGRSGSSVVSIVDSKLWLHQTSGQPPASSQWNVALLGIVRCGFAAVAVRPHRKLDVDVCLFRLSRRGHSCPLSRQSLLLTTRTVLSRYEYHPTDRL